MPWITTYGKYSDTLILKTFAWLATSDRHKIICPEVLERGKDSMSVGLLILRYCLFKTFILAGVTHATESSKRRPRTTFLNLVIVVSLNTVSGGDPHGLPP